MTISAMSFYTCGVGMSAALCYLANRSGRFGKKIASN